MPDFVKVPLEEEFAWYLYGIVLCGENDRDIDTDLTGISAEPGVRIIVSGSLGAVVSRVPLSQFGAAVLEEKLQDLRWLEEKVRLHQELLQQIMQEQTIIPMKFGTIFQSQERVRDILEEQQEHFQALLKFLTGHEEWGVKGYYRREELHEYLKSGECSPKPGQGGTGLGKAYLLRKKLEEELESRAVDYSRQIGEEAYGWLRVHSVRSTLNKFLSRNVTGREEELFFNGAFLVAKGSHGAFRHTVEKLNGEFGAQGIFLEVSGPWPPYSFVGE